MLIPGLVIESLTRYVIQANTGVSATGAYPAMPWLLSPTVFPQMLLQIADDFIESVVTAACQLARHRKSSTLEVKNVQLHLERQWNMWIPGFSSEEIRPYKKACTTEAHREWR